MYMFNIDYTPIFPNIYHFLKQKSKLDLLVECCVNFLEASQKYGLGFLFL